MTDAELDRLDAFLAEKVMGWTWTKGGTATSPDGYTLSIDAWLPAEGYIRGGDWKDRQWKPTRFAADAEEVREKWLREHCGTEFSEISLICENNCWAASVTDHKTCLAQAEANSLRLAELLAIARACGYEETP